jgi:hypothetical protein
MSGELGDPVHADGDTVTVYNDSGASIPEGTFVTVTGEYVGEHPTIAKADVDGAGGALVGVLKEPTANGDYGTVVLRGVVPARVASGVGVGAELGAPATGTAGTAGVAEAGGSSGILTMSPDESADGDGNVSEVLLR